jgi:glutaredoxin
MNFPIPAKGKFTIYSKSGCINCSKVKMLLKEKQFMFDIVDCDEFILENKEEFLEFMKNMIGQEYRMFPMVFDNKIFIGGYNETVSYLEQLFDFDMSF